MEMPMAEVIDKYTILLLKNERLEEDLIGQVDLYRKEIPDSLNEYVDRLLDINSKCWDLEADIRKGKEEELGLAEVGRRALKLRDLNKTRVSIKNEIVKCTGTGFLDVKINHASEEI